MIDYSALLDNSFQAQGLPTWQGNVTLPGANGVPTITLPGSGAPVQNGGTVTNTVSGKAAPDVKGILVAVAVVSVITLALPEKYGVWFPWVILLGYGASHPNTVSQLFGAGAQSVGRASA